MSSSESRRLHPQTGHVSRCLVFNRTTDLIPGSPRGSSKSSPKLVRSGAAGQFLRTIHSATTSELSAGQVNPPSTTRLSRGNAFSMAACSKPLARLISPVTP
jgi:hypothetical protein